MDAIADLAQSKSIALIEDCAQAHGAKYRGRSIGSIGDLSAWSFCQDKIMTTGGEGGMVTTNDSNLGNRVWSLKDHGKSYDAIYNRQHAPGFRWLHETLGHNWRMMETQGTIGRIQLKRMPDWTKTRTHNSLQIQNTAKKHSIFRVPEIPDHIDHAWYKSYIFIEPSALKVNWDRDRVMNEITALGVPCFSGSCSEVYLEKAFESTEIRPQEGLPNAQELGETSLMFLVHPTLTKSEIQQTCSAITKVAQQAQR